MPALSIALIRSYVRTTYRAELPGGWLELRVGQRHPVLDEVLAAAGLETWAFLTAWNPRSEPLSADENRARHAALIDAVRQMGHPAWPGAGVGDDPAWPPEASLLVGGLSPADAAALGRRFDQHAVVCGRRGEPARLLFLGGEEIDPILRAAAALDPEGVVMPFGRSAGVSPAPDAAETAALPGNEITAGPGDA